MRLPGFRPLESAAGRTFQAGLLPLDRGRRVGVVRIAFFMPRAFPEYCARAALAAGLGPDSACDDDCGNAIEGRAGRLLNDGLVATVRELEQAGATSILIDVTRNDGGSDWAEVVARVLAGPLRSARIAMLRHPAWTAFVEQRLQRLDAAARTATGPTGARLRRAAARLQEARAALSQPCDLGAAWHASEPTAAPPCSNLIDGILFATGVFDSDEDAPAGVSADLYSPALYAPYPLRVTPLPLMVLVDGDRTRLPSSSPPCCATTGARPSSAASARAPAAAASRRRAAASSCRIAAGTSMRPTACACVPTAAASGAA